MRRNLGVDPGPVAPAPVDPLRGARQAIRSQAAAREYVERQLAHAEASIQDLRNKLHRARQDKDAAAEAARSATARTLHAERALAATGQALVTEKAARARSDRVQAEAQVTARDLQVRLDAAVLALETTRSELAAERQAHQKTEAALRDAIAERRHLAEPEPPAAAVVRRPVGRPRKIVANAAAPSVTRPADAPKGKLRRVPADSQEPVQWWVEGWKPGRR
jgi:hypothetical protein